MMRRLLAKVCMMCALLLAVGACQKVEDGEPDLLLPAQTGKGNKTGGSATGSGTGSSSGSGSTGSSNSSTASGSGSGASGGAPQTFIEASDHVVIADLGQNAAGQHELLLVSLLEWPDIHSANNEAGLADEAAMIAAQYCEGTLSGWRIPTKAEAKAFIEGYKCSNPKSVSTNDDPQYSPALVALNARLQVLGGMPIDAWDTKYNDRRYLCEEARYSFAFIEGKTVSEAGKVKTYALRLVKTITSTQLTSP